MFHENETFVIRRRCFRSYMYQKGKNIQPIQNCSKGGRGEKIKTTLFLLIVKSSLKIIAKTTQDFHHKQTIAFKHHNVIPAVQQGGGGRKMRNLRKLNLNIDVTLKMLLQNFKIIFFKRFAFLFFFLSSVEESILE